MVLYRSIGEEEFKKLIDGEEISGKFFNTHETQNNSSLNYVCCFFKEKIRWKDDRHKFFIKTDIPANKILGEGTGIYYASKMFAITKTWNGKRGKTRYELEEVYISSYSIHNVLKIYGHK